MPQTDLILPAGVVFAFGGTTAPTGYLLCDGTSYLRTDYPALFANIGTAHGAADGTHFNVPDYRGRFLRGQDHGQGRDPDAAGRTTMASGGNSADNVGSVQGHAFQTHLHVHNAHGHTYFVGNSNSGSQERIGRQNNSPTNGGNSAVGSNDQANAGIQNQTTTENNAVASGTFSQPSGNESRPVNANVNYIIKI
ncbi:MAG: phage tail protein [Candidatus Methanoperedens sp.]|nr:phage tail protein [Candidatus Methanoperedens sp.]